jgi:integrase
MAHMNENSLLDDVTTERVDQYISKLKDLGNSGSTINRKLAAASALFTFAHTRAKCKTRPHFERQKEGEGRTSYITHPVEARILAYLAQWGYDDHAEVVCVLVDTGLRPSELWRLTEKDINLGIGRNGLLIVQKSKNGKKRAVPLTERVKEIISRRMEVTVSGPLFPYDKNWLERVWARVRSQMDMDGDPEFVPYILRHTCASRLIQRKVDLTVVQEWLGHKSILVTRKYSHHAPENLMDAVEVLEQ